MYYLKIYDINVLDLYHLKLNHHMVFIYILNLDHENIFLLMDQNKNIIFYFKVDTFNKLYNKAY